MARQPFARLVIWLLAFGAGMATSRGDDGPPSTADRSFFEIRIRPVLITHCYGCHGAEADEVGGDLRLDHRDGLRRGGQSGAVIVPGQPERSLLIRSLRHAGPEMPPDAPLPEPVIRDFEEWVRRGAPDPRGVAAASVAPIAAASGVVRPVLWSLQPVSAPSHPQVRTRGWSRDPLDDFVLSKIEAAGLRPARDAPSRTIVRRLHVDLLGVPPAAEEVEAFVREHGRDGHAAVERLIDALLDRPQFGERWGRHWLDVVRYGESNGNDGLGRNPTFPHAWRYRDYVIASLNADVPYDRFLTEQVAGDLLPFESPKQRDRQLVATGMLALGAKPAKAMNDNFAMDVVADQIDVVGRGILGLSIGCARCHDHKFDPIPTRDYYALAGVFASTENLWGMAGHEGLTAPATDLHVLESVARVPPPEGFVETVLVPDSNTGTPRQPPPPKWPPGTPLAMGVRDVAEPKDCRINVQGDAKKPGDPVPRGFLSACGVTASGELEIGPRQSGRLQLARWLTSPDHPLTARVLVNRVWMHLFGKGLVATPNDFGVAGERPSHPELLDHLAVRFVHDGWSLKRLVRAVALSRTYLLDSAVSMEAMRIDPENRLLARHARRRLDAESLRDAMLAASGRLVLEPPDGSIIRHRDILVNLAGSLHEPSDHRSVYLCYLRSAPPPSLAAFDLPDFSEPVGQRDESTVPGQALHLLNNEFVVDQAEHLARRLIRDAAAPGERVQAAFRRVFARAPDAGEVSGALTLVSAIEADLHDGHTGFAGNAAHELAWAGLCQALLAANEFRYVD